VVSSWSYGHSNSVKEGIKVGTITQAGQEVETLHSWMVHSDHSFFEEQTDIVTIDPTNTGVPMESYTLHVTFHNTFQTVIELGIDADNHIAEAL